MRILHITYAFPPILNIADGITNVVYHVTRELAKRGHDVSVYASNAWNLNSSNRILEKELFIHDNLRVRYSNFPFKWGTFFFTPSIVQLLRETIGEFDIMHMHDARSFQGITSSLIASRHKIPYVFQPHGSFLSPLPYSVRRQLPRVLLDKLVSEKIVKKAACILALTINEAKRYVAMGIPKNRIAIIPNGVDLSEFGTLPCKGVFKKKQGINKHEKVILYLGRIHKTKGIDLLVKAFDHLIRNIKYKDVLLVIIGPDDGYLKEVRSLINRLGLSEYVSLIGFVDNEEKLAALVDADLLVTPSFYGFPMTFLEACATGTPIVTTRLGDSLKWIDGNAGSSTGASSEELANAMHRILTDSRLHDRFSRNCLRMASSEFSLERIVSKLVEVYEGVIRKAS